jgi:SAM-dependent methyltransferase
MLHPIDDPLVRALRLDRPYRIAEVGSGGGGTTREISRQAQAGSVVHGFDITPGLVELARERAQGFGPGVVFEIADMASARPEQPYQRLVSRFGVMFFEEPEGAFANLREWLEPGGWFAFAVWGSLADNPWMTAVCDVVGEAIDLPPPSAETPGPFRYGDAAPLLAQLEGVGFSQVESTDWRGSLAIGGGLPPAEAAEFALSAFSSFREKLAESGEEALEQTRRSLTQRFSHGVKDGVVRLGACVHLVTGTRN